MLQERRGGQLLSDSSCLHCSKVSLSNKVYYSNYPSSAFQPFNLEKRVQVHCKSDVCLKCSKGIMYMWSTFILMWSVLPLGHSLLLFIFALYTLPFQCKRRHCSDFLLEVVDQNPGVQVYGPVSPINSMQRKREGFRRANAVITGHPRWVNCGFKHVARCAFSVLTAKTQGWYWSELIPSKQ